MNVSALFVHPVKSMRGIHYASAYASHQGLLHDREWLVTRQDGSFITAREFPQLLLLEATPIPGAIVLQAPDRSPIAAMTSVYTRSINTRVWKDAFCGYHGDRDVDAWLSDYLGCACQLLWLGARSTRRQQTTEHGLSFADGYPYLLITEASLAALNAELANPIDARAMRPNLVIAGTKPYEEDDWQLIRIGECLFDVAKPCTRCVLTTIDPATGIRNTEGEPLKTLIRTRRRKEGVCFGINLVLREEGMVRCSDDVEILA